MKYYILPLFLLLAFSFSADAQYHYRITSLPDSAEVYFNGELRGHTPLLLKFFWRNNQDGQIKLEVKKDGYKDWTDVITSKPMDLDETEFALLDPDFEMKERKDQPLLAFDRLLVDFRDDKVIGSRRFLDDPTENINWRGNIKIGDESYGEKFIDVATSMGFNTLRSEHSQLFAGQKNERPKLPRFIIGANLLDIDIQMQEEKMKHFFDPMRCKTSVEIEWNVLDKKNGKVVYQSVHIGEFQFRQEVYQQTEYIQKAYVNSLIKFLSSEGFNKLIDEADNYKPIAEELNSNTESIEIASADRIRAEGFSNLVKEVNQACVSIITDGGHGSGAVIDKNGYILTAYHVVEGVNKIEVKFSSGIQLPAELVSSSKLNDVAILKISGSGYTALRINTETEAGLGDDVFTIGTPADIELGQSISRGIVSGKRKIEEQIYLQLDMAVSPGNSGGPLINQKGEIIGIVLRKIIDEGVEGIGFAVPSKEIVEALKLELN